MKVGLVLFPGTNCDHDVVVASNDLFGADPEVISSRSRELPANLDLLFLPGGFSYGDYLRAGAMAKVSPIMKSVKEFGEKGGKIVGICNGFQILCEAGLLPGVLLPNKTTRFISRPVTLKVENSETYLTNSLSKGDLITAPIAHFEGNYFAAPEVIKELEENNQVLFRYCSSEGEVNHEDPNCNPNGSANSIAGITNAKGNILGFMPHPERAIGVGVPLDNPAYERGASRSELFSYQG